MAVTIDGTTGITSPAIDLTTPLAVSDGGTGQAVALTAYTTQTTPLPSVTTAVSVAHTLGVTPDECMLEWVCLTAEHGYSIGDVISTPFVTTSGYHSTVQVWRNATTVGYANYSLSVNWLLINKTTGVNANPTLANWAYRFRLRTL